MTKSSAAEKARRVNVTVSLLQQAASGSEVLDRLVDLYGFSRRQAHRYLSQARQASGPLPIPEEKVVFTVKVPYGLVASIRRQARRQRCAISLCVEEALRRWLAQSNSHG